MRFKEFYSINESLYANEKKLKRLLTLSLGRDVEEFIAQEKEGAFNYTVIKYNVTKKERKQKGEIIDTWYRVEIIKEFNDEREPASTVEVRYEG